MIYHKRQKYIDLTDLADASHCDILQPKYDGIWGRIEIDAHRGWRIYSRTGALKAESHSGVGEPVIVLLGEYMYGSQWAKETGREGKFYVFDCPLYQEQLITHKHYASRLHYARDFVNASHGIKFLVNVPTHPFDPKGAKKAWDHYVEKAGFEGLVFRHSTDSYHDPVYRKKANFEVDLQVVSMAEGEGKYKNCLGALLCRDHEDRTHMIGGGFTDEQRKSWWRNPSLVLGKTITVECKKIFDSGKLRHPNFKRFHLEK